MSDSDNSGQNVDDNTTNDEGVTVVDIKPFDQKKLRPLTPKEQKYVEIVTTEHKASKREAVRRAYNVKDGVSPKTLDSMSDAIERRTPVLTILNAHARRAEELLQELTEKSMDYAREGGKEGAMYATVAERSLNSVLDRVHGKAKQTMDVQSTSVSISIDMSASEQE